MYVTDLGANIDAEQQGAVVHRRAAVEERAKRHNVVAYSLKYMVHYVTQAAEHHRLRARGAVAPPIRRLLSSLPCMLELIACAAGP